MALTRKFLTALGIESEKVDEIISAHSDTVNALKEERDGYKEKAEEYKAEADKVEGLTKQIADLESKGESDEWETKYNDLKTEYDAYKSDIATKETKQAKEKAYRQLLKDASISEKRFDAIMKVTSLDDLELDEEGKIKDADKLTENIKQEWSDFVVTQGQKGAETATPPANNPGQNQGESRAAILAKQYHDSVYGATKED